MSRAGGMSRGTVPGADPALAVGGERWDGIGVHLVHADLYPCAPAWRIATKRLEYDGLFHIWKGHGWIEIDGHRLDALPGDIFLSRRGRRFAAGHDPKHPFTVLSTGFSLRDAAGADPLRTLPAPDRLRPDGDGATRLREGFLRVVAARAEATSWSGAAARGAVLCLLAEFLRLAATLPADASATAGGVAPPPDETRAAAVIAHVDRHLAERLTSAALARVAGLTVAHFAVAFRGWTGLAPMEFVRRRRIEVARGLLGESDAPVERIAERVGFPDPHHFNRVFRALVGMPPGRYRASIAHPFGA